MQTEIRPSERSGMAAGSTEFARTMSSLEALLYQEEALFDIPEVRARELLAKNLFDAFAWHYRNCPSYGRYCERIGFTPLTFASPADIDRIPLLPTSLFKRFLIHSCDEGSIEKICLSSGTRGGQSRIPRDQPSLERFVGSVRALLQVAPRTRESAAQLFVLSPDSEEAADLWLAYALSVTEVLFPARFYVSRGCLDTTGLLRDLANLESSVQPILIGPPPTLLEFVNEARARGARLTLGVRDGYVITAGGWKRATEQAIEREPFKALITDALGLAGLDSVRDCFNMVELNTVLMSCKEGNFHLPPTLHIVARSPETLAPLPAGSEGILAICDATPTSYPAFILSDDFGVAGDYGSCACRLTSPWFRQTRRMSTVEARGCARKIDALTSARRSA